LLERFSWNNPFKILKVDWFPLTSFQTGTGGGDRTLQLEVKFFDLQETNNSEGILQKCFHLSSVKAGADANKGSGGW